MTAAIDIVIPAAGRSSRMGGPHKLLARFAGVALIRRSVLTALATRICAERGARVIIVTGYRGAEVSAALADLDVEIVENAAFEAGLSISLKAGFAASRAEGALVMLADQPLLLPEHLDALADAFRTEGQSSIVVATDKGRRFNPVILSARFREEVEALKGDVGAKSILARHARDVTEVEIGAAASTDVDTPEAMVAAGGEIAD